MDEKATTTGFAFDKPTHEFKCVSLDTDNYDDFTTGYNQWLFTALDDALECEETVTLTKSEHASDAGATVDFTIRVTKKACEILECPTGEVQDAYFCGCIAEPEIQGELIDFAVTKYRTARYINVGDIITMKEYSNSVDGRTYQFKLPDATDMNLACVQEVSRTDTGYWRQVIFEATEPDCEDAVERDSNVDANARPETLNFRVYPAEEPPVLGVFFDMDAFANREISVQKGGYFTVRVNEAATDNGFAWDAPTTEVLSGLGCVELLDTNYGDYKTGYRQYVF